MIGFVLVFVMAQAAPTAQSPRVSEDGAALPTYSDRKFAETVPLADDLIGALPEEVAPRIYSTERSKERAARADLPPPPCEWFAFQVNGAKMASFALIDGRVSDIRFFFERLSPKRILQLQQQFGALNPDGDTANWRSIEVGDARLSVVMEYQIEHDADGRPQPIIGSAIIEISMPPSECWMLNNEVSDEVRAAARGGKACNGMTLELAHAVFGTPTNISTFEGLDQHQWVIEEDTYSFSGGMLHYTGKAMKRLVTITFTDGVASSVQDDNF